MSDMAVAVGISLMCIMLFFTIFENIWVGVGLGSLLGFVVFLWLDNWYH